MIILDTNLISETLRPRPAPAVAAWYRQQNPDDLAITTVTVAELLAGVRLMPEGARRRKLAAAIDYALLPMLDSILSFDAAAALDYADIQAVRTRMGRPISPQDAMIAAIARSRDMALATRNVKDFAGTGVTLINPWDAGAQTITA
ncbi:pilus assembly protein [Bifidobacterium sp. DSM 109958]|uniref:Ribonuclease VapC n=1 Tax=Bifidobacterium moraviense TaxID=2675323 RepID=A0A7Y0F2E9_9BIFI|nr:type II toxin-antitoxin system VapC family toxin [Bifidobacterium sp. DSM 109958]NMN00779.1 pilus assembly protein [Bifidobacterium sp. DSM 109958]